MMLYSGTIIAVESSTPVTSITITGTSSVKVGSSVTLTATSSPTSADDRGVTWSVSSGSSYVTISGSTTSTGGTCTVTGKAAGTAVIKATASDGSGVSKTYSVTVSNNTYYLYYNANGGSGAPSTQSYSSGSSSTHTFTISSTEPTRNGYTFLGWSTSSSATTASYNPGDTISVSKNSSKTLYAVWQEDTTPVTSISISGNSTVNVGSTLTLTATTSPTTADDRHVTWSITSGSSRVTYTTSDTTTGGKITLTGVSSGSVTVKATAADGSGVSATKTITVNAVQYTSTLAYNANGGTGAPDSDTYTGTSTSNHTFTISSTEPTRSGYTFLGWATSSSATSATYDPGDTISVGYNSTVTLYAIWSHTITLTFSANSGSGAPSAESWTGVGSHTFTIPTTTPTRTNWTFLGWGTSSSGSTVNYDPGDTITLSASDTLYAKWSRTLTLTYNANSGSGAPSSQSYTIYSGTTSHSFTISSTEPTRTGYTFLGWATSSSATAATYVPGDSISIASNITLYAIWSHTITITYNANGGSGAPSAESWTGVGSHTFTISTTQPTRSGYTFLGWATTSSATSANSSYDPGDSVSRSSSLTLYAVWQEDTTPVTSITITGTSSVKVGSSVTLTATSSPTSADDRGVTWSISSGSSYVTISGSTTSTGGTCTVTGKAAGTAVIKATASDGSGVSKTYSVTVSNNTYYLYYNANNGTGAPSTQSYSGGTASTHTFTISSTEPTRSGYTFLGWSTSSSATTASYDPGDTISVSKNSSKTLYAVWKQNTYTHTLAYNANGGSGAPSSSTVTNTSSSHSMTVSTTEPTRSGYTFLGWSTSSSATTAAYDPGDSVTVGANATVTLYAVWKQNTYTHTLAYNANGGSNAPTSTTVTNTSSSYAVTVTSSVPTYANHVFLGWSRTSSGSATLHAGDTVTVGANATVTLYAVWETSILEITTSPGSATTLTVGKTFSYTVGTNVSGCTVGVSGASWLSVTNNVISGTPTEAGTYNVIVTISKDGGYTSDQQSFTVTVYSQMGFTSKPGADGIFAYVS